jgi:pyrimidine oxygenase
MGATGAGEMIRVGQRAKELGRELGREAKTMGLFMVIPGKTDLDAQARVDRYNEGVDVEAMSNRTLEYSADVHTGNNTAKRMVDAGTRQLAVSPSAIVGSPDTIADQLAHVVLEGDLDGVVVIMPDFIDDLGTIGEQVLPRLADRGVFGEHLSVAV